MENIGDLVHGFQVALTGYHLMLMVAGVLFGILVGVLPGLGAPNGVTLLIPLTFSMDPVSAIILLASMYWGALFGGSTTSILFNIPGEPSSVATTFDGHPMAKQGRATEALSYAFLSAAFGALFGVVVITLLAGSRGGLRSQVLVAGVFRRLLSCLRVFRRPRRCFAVQDPGVGRHGLLARDCWHGHDLRVSAADVRVAGSGQGGQLPGRGHRPVRHRRADCHDGGAPRVPRRAAHVSRRAMSSRRSRRCRPTGSCWSAPAWSAAGWGSHPAVRRPRRS